MTWELPLLDTTERLYRPKIAGRKTYPYHMELGRFHFFKLKYSTYLSHTHNIWEFFSKFQRFWIKLRHILPVTLYIYILTISLKFTQNVMEILIAITNRLHISTTKLNVSQHPHKIMSKFIEKSHRIQLINKLQRHI